MKLNGFGKSSNQVQVITCVKIVLGKSFQEEIRIFILDESNEKILKLEELF